MGFTGDQDDDEVVKVVEVGMVVGADMAEGVGDGDGCRGGGGGGGGDCDDADDDKFAACIK